MDLNLVVIAGRLAATPDVLVYEGGTTVTRLLVTTRTEEPRHRIDVVPVVAWDIDVPDMVRGDRVWVAGSIQRRFWSEQGSRRSRIEIVASTIQATQPTEEES